jgi:Cdc6-like AAA superfamily ATPase
MSERLTRLNPFNPKKPASPIYFAGRVREISTVVRCISQTFHGESENILVTGERGIGKTSLAYFVKHIAEKKEAPDGFSPDFNFLVSFNQLKSKMSQDDVIQLIVGDLKHLTLKTIPERMKKFFDDEIKSFSFGKLFSLERKEKSINFSEEFARYLEAIWDRIQDRYTGLIIVLDEFDQLSALAGFASFWKSLYEKLDIDGYKKIMFVFVGLSRKLDPFFEDHPSVVRLFEHIEVSLMNAQESEQVINKALEQTNPRVTISREAMEAIIRFSGGYPQFIQELGYATFEMDNDNHLDMRDFIRGVEGNEFYEGAIKQLGRKLFDKMYLQDIGSDTYRKILSAIARHKKETIKPSEISKQSGISKKVVGTYLRNMVKRNILVKEIRGEYHLVNRLFGVYILLYEKKLENSKKLPLLEKE